MSELVNISRRSLEYFFNASESAEIKYQTLSISAGRGSKIELESVKNLLPDPVRDHSRNLNPILEELLSKYNINLPYRKGVCYVL